MLKEQIASYMENHRQQMIDDISALVRIQSDRGEPAPGAPFGKGPAAALEKAMEICAGKGFTVQNWDGYVCTADMNDKAPQLDILAHLDVVPVSDGWTVTAPFEPKLVGNKLYGRGTADDKGPAVAALYAMMAVKELGIPLAYNCRLILGTDEECGSSDIHHYYQKQPEAPCTFSPDAEFPCINIEKGSIRGFYHASYPESSELPRIVSVTAGTKINVVPNRAEAVVEGFGMDVLQAVAGKVTEDTGVSFAFEGENTVTIHAQGQDGHAAMPEKGNNAITALLTLLTALPAAKSEGFEKLCAFQKLYPHGDWSGLAAGIAMEDAESGALTCSLDIFNLTTTGFEAQTDCRCPICSTDENVTAVLKAGAEAIGLTLDESCKLNAPHYVPADSPFIQTLLSAYEKYTGQKGEPLAIGGGTYTHHLKNGVAFGCEFPGSEDNHMHGNDEFVNIDELVLSAQIFAQVIVDLCAEKD